LYMSTSKSRWICTNPREDSLILHCRLNIIFQTPQYTKWIYETYQTDIYLSLEDFWREVARWRTHWEEIRQYCFGVSAGWLALVVCLPHRLGILSDISIDLAELSADWYNSS
jgi:hypothetical protein